MLHTNNEEFQELNKYTTKPEFIFFKQFHCELNIN